MKRARRNLVAQQVANVDDSLIKAFAGQFQKVLAADFVRGALQMEQTPTVAVQERIGLRIAPDVCSSWSPKSENLIESGDSLLHP